MSLNGLFLSFSGLCDLKIIFSKKNSKINFLQKKNFPNFSNSCSLNIFEPKIWRRLETFPSCSSLICAKFNNTELAVLSFPIFSDEKKTK